MASIWDNASLITEEEREMGQPPDIFAEKSQVRPIHISLAKARQIDTIDVNGMKKKIIPQRGHHRKGDIIIDNRIRSVTDTKYLFQ